MAERVIVELKAKEKIGPMDGPQLLTYLRLSGLHLGLLINFHERRLVEGVHRTVNDLAED